MQLSAQEKSQPLEVVQFLKFNLSLDMTALLPIHQLAAVLKIEAAKITAIPHLPAWVMGVYNWRGEILWIVDTGHLLGGAPWYHQSTAVTKHDVLLLERKTAEIAERCFLGLWVRQVEGIELLSLDRIQSPTAVSEMLVPFLRGYWLDSSGDMLTLLDGAAIFDRMPS
ncbi:MAG: chemotaxis protein CheW [Leptolyngbya sp. SIO3F4]|nr:chemotaxis protein CheW [Leptolyngbya sp. SIO3F4]